MRGNMRPNLTVSLRCRFDSLHAGIVRLSHIMGIDKVARRRSALGGCLGINGTTDVRSACVLTCFDPCT